MEQKKRKFNSIDVIIVCALVVGIAFAAIRISGSGDTDPASESEYYHVTFFAECVPASVADELFLGSIGTNGSRNMDLGKLVDFSVGEGIVYIADAEGNFVKATKEDYCSVSLTFELAGVQEPTGLLVGDYHLNVGYYMSIFVGNAFLNTFITDITPLQ